MSRMLSAQIKRLFILRKKYNQWLETEKADVPYTMNIRKNTSLCPDVFTTKERVTEHVYPYEETGYTVEKIVHHKEDLEFEMNNKKCGFWFNPNSSADELLQSFKNMFNNMYNNK